MYREMSMTYWPEQASRAAPAGIGTRTTLWTTTSAFGVKKMAGDFRTCGQLSEEQETRRLPRCRDRPDPEPNGYCGVAIAIGCIARDNLKSWPRGRTRADVTGSTSSAERFGHNMVSAKPTSRDSNMPTAHLIHGYVGAGKTTLATATRAGVACHSLQSRPMDAASVWR